MENTIAAVTILILAGASLQTVKAGDWEGVTIGKILAGVAAGAVVANTWITNPHTIRSSIRDGPRAPPWITRDRTSSRLGRLQMWHSDRATGP